MTDFTEVKKLIEEQGRAWEEFKRTNDEIIKAKADGKDVGDLQVKLENVSAGLDKIADLKSEFDQFVLKSQRPDMVKVDEEAAAECKQWNAMLRADFQSKGRSMPAEVTTDEYAQYKSGFFEMVRHGNVERLTAEQRKAMSAGSDPDGGYLLPATTVGRIVSKVYEKSIMRQLATVLTISTGSIEGIVDNDEAAAGWVTELGSRSDSATPQLGMYRIEAHEMYAMPKASQKLIDDSAVNVENWLAEKVADKFARVESSAFWNGTGVGQPRGLATYTTAATSDDSRAWGTFEHVVTGSTSGFDGTTKKADPLQDLMGALKDEYHQGAVWVMRREMRTQARKLKEATSDRYLWEPSLQAAQPERLNGYPVRVDQFMPTVASNSLSVAFGNFKEAYTVVDRIGIRTLRDPYTAKPNVVFYSTRRVGGGALNFEAVKFLKCST